MSIGLGPYDLLRDATAQALVVPDPEVPVTILSVPKAWVIVMPCGCVDGIVRGSHRHPTAEAAWATFAPLKRSREAQQRKGWTVRAASASDIEAAQHAPTHEGHA